MPADCSAPPTERLAIALRRRGLTEAARAIAPSLHGGESPDPDPPLDFDLLRALIDESRWIEARVLAGSGAIDDPRVARARRLLASAFAPWPDGADPAFAAVTRLIDDGLAPSALRALQEIARAGSPPPWLADRVAAIGSLVHGDWVQAAEAVGSVTRDTVVAQIRNRDLTGALDSARLAGAQELAAVLDRLVAATEAMVHENREIDRPTVPMQGHELAAFHIRIGMLDHADRSYREILRANPEDARARAILGDVIALRRALGENPDLLPRRRTAVDWLRKSSPRSGAWSAGWASGSSAIDEHPPFRDVEEESTASVGAAQEAELLLQVGKARAALEMYRLLALARPSVAQRLTEIEALVAQRVDPAAGEVTARLDLSRVPAQALPTRPRIVLSVDHPPFSDDDDEPTDVDTMPHLARDDDR